MDREILFRGRTIKTRFGGDKWIEGFYVMSCAGRAEMEPAIITGTEKGCFMTEFIDPATVGQYVFLEDTKDKQIFTGDILKDPDRECLYVVDFIGGGFGLFTKKEYLCLKHRHQVILWDGLSEPQTVCFVTQNLEVIGNIHDNFELLKEEAE